MECGVCFCVHRNLLNSVDMYILATVCEKGTPI